MLSSTCFKGGSYFGLPKKTIIQRVYSSKFQFITIDSGICSAYSGNFPLQLQKITSDWMKLPFWLFWNFTVHCTFPIPVHPNLFRTGMSSPSPVYCGLRMSNTICCCPTLPLIFNMGGGHDTPNRNPMVRGCLWEMHRRCLQVAASGPTHPS